MLKIVDVMALETMCWKYRRGRSQGEMPESKILDLVTFQQKQELEYDHGNPGAYTGWKQQLLGTNKTRN